MDAGDLTGWAHLLAHGRYVITDAGEIAFDEDPAGLEAFFREHFFMGYEDGTPHTLHSSSNAVIDIEPGGVRATCDSRLTVFQAVSRHLSSRVEGGAGGGSGQAGRGAHPGRGPPGEAGLDQCPAGPGDPHPGRDRCSTALAL